MNSLISEISNLPFRNIRHTHSAMILRLENLSTLSALTRDRGGSSTIMLSFSVALQSSIHLTTNSITHPRSTKDCASSDHQLPGFNDRVGEHFAITPCPISLVACRAATPTLEFVEVCRLLIVVQAVIRIPRTAWDGSYRALCPESSSHHSVRSRVVTRTPIN